jgi:ribosome biogenesis GTPase
MVQARTGASVALVSAISEAGLTQIHQLVEPGETAVLLGSSGAGKSTLTNALLGYNLLRTTEVRTSDSRGRHTTTAREMFLLPAGWLLIDTPGLREVGAWAAGDALDEVFSDIASLASRCRFSDCRHQTEPGCAVREAEASGVLDAERLQHFTKLSRETTEQEFKRQGRIAQRAIRQLWKMRGRK